MDLIVAQRRARWTWLGLRAEFWCAAARVLRFRLRFVRHPVAQAIWAVRWPSLVLSGPVWSGPPRSGLVKSSLGPAQSLRVQSCRVWSVQPWPVWSGLAQSSPHVISATTRKYTQAGKPMAGHTCCKCDQVCVPPHPRQIFGVLVAGAVNRGVPRRVLQLRAGEHVATPGVWERFDGGPRSPCNPGNSCAATMSQLRAVHMLPHHKVCHCRELEFASGLVLACVCHPHSGRFFDVRPSRTVVPGGG